MRIREIGTIALYESEVLSQFDSLVHGFTTRQGGVSSGAYKSLSMSPRRGDDIGCVRKNEEILCRELSLPLSRLSSTRQEHTDTVRVIDEKNIGVGVAFPWEYGVDACITTVKNVPILCYSADCVPVLMYTPDIEGVAAVHAGWKGTESHIVGKTVEKMISMGASPKNIYAAIGPCIGQCCYEVDSDVAHRFDEKYSVKKPMEKYMLDLGRVNYDILISCGVKAENISLSGICTKCNNKLFFSHRGQGGKSGTLGGIICMRD